MESTGIELRPTDDFDSMVRLAREAGLEIQELGPTLAAYGLFESERLVGCACLKEHDGIFLLECLAVSDRLRGMGLGTRIVRAIEEEARGRGAKTLRAIARKPGFFLKIGYHVADPEEVDFPSTEGCTGCPQFKKTCSPAIVMREL
jgi:N-acetylglutamate synthase-like GNAT family acetyltransferase